MLVERVSKLKPIERLTYWIKERHAIYLRKKVGKPKPWTDDRILQSFYFCNPYRENDKVTTWLRENVRDPLRGKPSVLFAVIAFRWFNWIPTGQILDWSRLLYAWNTNEAVRILTRECKGQIFTGAFNISNSGSTKPKINRVCEDYIQPVWEDRQRLWEEAKHWETLQRAFDFISQYSGLGGSGFMTAQVIADLKYTVWLEKAKDWWTWCCLGPGSKRGLNRLLVRPVDEPISKGWQLEMVNVQTLIHQRLPVMPRMHMQDVQNCLCEWDKYERARQGDGHMKRTYPGV